MVRTTKNLYMYLLCFCPREHHHRYVGISFVWTPFYPLFMLSWTFSHIILTVGTQQEFFFAGIDEPSAVQCVGSHIECERMEPAEAEPRLVADRRSRLVFIGRLGGMEDALRQSWAGLLASCT